MSYEPLSLKNIFISEEGQYKIGNIIPTTNNTSSGNENYLEKSSSY